MSRPEHTPGRRRRAPAPAAEPLAEPYLDRTQALALLGIKPQTLYAYVSRGWIRSVRRPGGGKQSLYAREDVEKVKARASARTGHGVAAAGAMRWGEPIIPTSITEIGPDGPRYRGRAALALARADAPFEAVAELLWTGLWLDDRPAWRRAPLPAELAAVAGRVAASRPQEHLMELFALCTLHLGIHRGSTAQRLRAAAPLDAARQLVQALVGCTGVIGPQRGFDPMRPGETVSGALLRILGADAGDENRRAIECVLVLLADHELTSSTFAARVAASAGALLHGCVTAALATNAGLEIGRLYDRIEAFVAPARSADDLYRRADAMQAQGLTPPGFNHPIYPRGDPRADVLLALVASRRRVAPKARAVLDFADRARSRMGLHPRVEIGVVAVCRQLRLPAHAAGALFTIARTAGWVAHVLEQRTAGFLLRPRARFTAAPAAD